MGENWKLFPAPQYGRRRLTGSGGSGGAYLPIAGGTMQGDINMGGYKITQLGQNNLQGRDAVNYSTLVSASTNIEIASDGIFGLSATLPVIETIQKPPAFTSVSNDFVIPLVPGSLTTGGITETNWAYVAMPNIPSFILTSNNVLGKFSGVKLTTQFQFDFSSSQIATLPVYLLVFNFDNGAVLASGQVNIVSNSVDVIELVVALPVVSGARMSKLCCSLFAGVDTVSTDITVSQAQLIRFCYLFTN